MIQTICWSKNRAAQLDLTLQTYKNNFLEWKDQKVSIIYTASSAFYNTGYELLQSYHPEFTWIKETDFRSNTLNCINTSIKPYISFIVDDDVFIDKISLHDKEMQEFFNNETISTISPRLSKLVNYCYTQNAPAIAPIMNEKNIWNWRDGKCSGDWNYPFSVAAFHIFRKSDLDCLRMHYFRAPNTFEAAMNSVPFTGRDNMICYNDAKCFTAANNRVQIENNNRHENTHSIETLNKMFLEGHRLSPSVNQNMKSNACHGPVQYNWN